MHKRSMSSVHKCDIKSDHAALIITDFLFGFKQYLLFTMVVGNYRVFIFTLL